MYDLWGIEGPGTRGAAPPVVSARATVAHVALGAMDLLNLGFNNLGGRA